MSDEALNEEYATLLERVAHLLDTSEQAQTLALKLGTETMQVASELSELAGGGDRMHDPVALIAIAGLVVLGDPPHEHFRDSHDE